MRANETRPAESVDADLGLGRVLADESAQRYLNKDGSFNVRRDGLSWWRSLSPYYSILTMPWSGFFALLAVAFLIANLVFAGLYSLAGPGGLRGDEGATGGSFTRDFFFSVHTLATIGYGNVSPSGLYTNVVVTVEAFLGLLGVALATGLLFARFSRPTTRILFSRDALIAPYRGGQAFMCRVVNGLRTQVIQLEAQVTLSRFSLQDGRRVRRFYPLNLERRYVTFFPLAWTIVHPIDETSPLWGVTEAELRELQAEFDIVLHGLDDRLFQAAHARSSYTATEIVWGRRFSDMWVRDRQGAIVAADVRRLHHHEPALTPPSGEVGVEH